MPGRDKSPHKRRPVTETKLLWKRSASRLALIGVLGTGLAAPALAQTMDSALSRAYSGNPTLNSQRAAVRATNENVPQEIGRAHV